MSSAEKIINNRLGYEYVLSRLTELPTLPGIVGEITSLINDPMSSTKEVVNVLEKDQSLTTTVLKLINSAYYAIPGGVRSLERAITLLGFDEINMLVVSASVFKNLTASDTQGFNVKQFWQHSVGVAMTAETVARFVKHKAPHELFTAGLVHDMGKIALLKIDPEATSRLSLFARQNGLTFDQAEDQLQTVKHSIVGHMLAQKWNLPFHMQGAIRHHHTVDTERRKGISVEMNQFLDIIIFSNMFIHYIDFGDSGHDVKIKTPEDLNQRLSITDSNVSELAAKVKEALSTAESFLQVIGAT